MSLETSTVDFLNKYVEAKGAGHTSLMVRDAIIDGGFLAGISKFMDVCEVQAIRLLNQRGISHAMIPEATIALTIANPLIALLITNSYTHVIGLAINQAPLFEGVWGGSNFTEEQIKEIQHSGNTDAACGVSGQIARDYAEHARERINETREAHYGHYEPPQDGPKEQ